MAAGTPRTALVTGATAGIGREAVRLLAQRGDLDRICLVAPNRARIESTVAQLAASTGHRGLVPLPADVTDLSSVHTAIAEIADPVDVLILNAGGIGREPLEITDVGITRIAALNALGHVVLASGLEFSGRARGVIVNAGTEGSRGVPLFGIPKPRFADSVDGIVSVLDGSYYRTHRYSPTIAYGNAKYVGVLAMAAAARHYPDVRIVNVSPGATAGTEGINDLPAVQRVVLGTIAPRLGLAHGVEAGADRYLAAVDDPAFRSGSFYASAAHKLTGRLVDQGTIFPESANRQYQDNALAAIDRFAPVRIPAADQATDQ